MWWPKIDTKQFQITYTKLNDTQNEHKTTNKDKTTQNHGKDLKNHQKEDTRSQTTYNKVEKAQNDH